MADDQTTTTPPAPRTDEVGAVTQFISDHPILTIGGLATAFMLYKGAPGFLTAKNPRKKRRGKKA